MVSIAGAVCLLCPCSVCVRAGDTQTQEHFPPLAGDALQRNLKAAIPSSGFSLEGS